MILTKLRPLRVGRYEVTRLCDGVFQAPVDALTHIEGEAARQKAIARWGAKSIPIEVNCYALQSADGTALIDAGGGPLLGPSFGQVRTSMREAGISPEDVRHILITHIHDDHVLGLFEEESPYFPNAEILVPGTDFSFFTDPVAEESVPEARRGGFFVAERLRQIYGPRVRLCPEGQILPGIEARRLPGHTPGHTGYLLNGDTDALFLWGDTLHVGALQPSDPQIGMIYDLAPNIAAATRRVALEEAAQGGWVVAGGHIGFGRVLSVNDRHHIEEL
jgi:glyoxylase-like metal-dependent hydrolase (beta-lactamase superfamily II)